MLACIRSAVSQMKHKLSDPHSLYSLKMQTFLQTAAEMDRGALVVVLLLPCLNPPSRRHREVPFRLKAASCGGLQGVVKARKHRVPRKSQTRGSEAWILTEAKGSGTSKSGSRDLG